MRGDGLGLLHLVFGLLGFFGENVACSQIEGPLLVVVLLVADLDSGEDLGEGGE